MPRLVLRQWQTLGGAHAAIGKLCRPLRQFPSPAAAATVRSYARKSSSRNDPFPVTRPLNSAIVIPSSVRDAQPDHLINYINPVSHDDLAKDTFCVFLVTPSFASWLRDDDQFVAKAIRRAYSKAFTDAPGPLKIQALCAVVDKLPAGKALISKVPLDKQMVQHSIEPPVGEKGFEGFAFATLPTIASVTSISSTSSEQGAIDFIIAGQTAEDRLCSDIWRLPLANTVFQTGTPTTMHLSEWQLLPEHDTLIVQKKSEISHHGISINAQQGSSGRALSALSIPLLPLTLPRRVEGCMGNIIRRVIGHDERSVTASAELEKVVPQFFKSRGEAAQPTTAWALVIPKSIQNLLLVKTMQSLRRRLAKKEKGTQMDEVLWERLWRSDPAAYDKFVSRALREGARLHRVLSGGGGWGKKAGLLSLDPVPVSDATPIRMEDATNGFDGPGDFSAALTPVVDDGDAIQFFISPTSNTKTEASEHAEIERLKSLSKERSWGWQLGTVPSTVDSIPGGSWQHTGAESNNIAIFKHTFGALTEGGLTFTRRIEREQGGPLSTFVTSMVDVPYSRIWAVGLANKQGSTEDPQECDKIPVHITGQQGQTPSQVVASTDLASPRHHRTLFRRVVARNNIHSTSASDRLYRINDSITQVTEVHRSILYTLRRRQRRTRMIKALQGRFIMSTQRYNKSFEAYQKILLRITKDVGKRDSLLSTLKQPINQVPLQVSYSLPNRNGDPPKEFNQVPIRRIASNFTGNQEEAQKRPIKRYTEKHQTRGTMWHHSCVAVFEPTQEAQSGPEQKRESAAAERKVGRDKFVETVGSWLGGNNEKGTTEQDKGA